MLGLLQAMSEMNSESLLKAITTVTSNQTYYDNMKILSDIFRNNQNEPLDTAIWWIEYILKYKGAPHIQSPAKNLTWFRYLQLDIALIVFGSIYIIYDLIRQALNKSDSKKAEESKKQKKKN